MNLKPREKEKKIVKHYGEISVVKQHKTSYTF